METRIIQKESFKVVGISLETLLKDEREQRNIPKLHQEFQKRITEIKHRVNADHLGIFVDPPNYDYRTDKFKWIAGVEVSSFNDIPEGMESITIPANTYACTTYRGTRDQAYLTYDFLYQWVEESEYELADTYGIEQYPKEEDHEETVHIMELMLPIKEKRI